MRVRTKPGSVIGSFSKGDNAVSVNMATSAGPNCDRGCELLDNGCYAQDLEALPMRKNVLLKLQRHEKIHPARLISTAMVELQELERLGRLPQWLRFSSQGSAPQVDNRAGKPKLNKAFVLATRTFLKWLNVRNINIHWPLETANKANEYRKVFGDLVCIRESCTSMRRFLTSSKCMSFVVGKPGMKLIKRIELAREACKLRKEKTGRDTRMCPAIVNGFFVKLKKASKKQSALCGNCKHCSDNSIDVVYPFH